MTTALGSVAGPCCCSLQIYKSGVVMDISEPLGKEELALLASRILPTNFNVFAVGYLGFTEVTARFFGVTENTFRKCHQ